MLHRTLDRDVLCSLFYGNCLLYAIGHSIYSLCLQTWEERTFFYGTPGAIVMSLYTLGEQVLAQVGYTYWILDAKTARIAISADDIHALPPCDSLVLRYPYLLLRSRNNIYRFLDRRVETITVPSERMGRMDWDHCYYMDGHHVYRFDYRTGASTRQEKPIIVDGIQFDGGFSEMYTTDPSNGTLSRLLFADGSILDLAPYAIPMDVRTFIRQSGRLVVVYPGPYELLVSPRLVIVPMGGDAHVNGRAYCGRVQVESVSVYTRLRVYYTDRSYERILCVFPGHGKWVGEHFIPRAVAMHIARFLL